MKLNLALITLLLALKLLTGCTGGYVPVSGDLTTPCSNGTMPWTEESKGMVVCSE
jgi:hypothetical protein